MSKLDEIETELHLERGADEHWLASSLWVDQYGDLLILAVRQLPILQEMLNRAADYIEVMEGYDLHAIAELPSVEETVAFLRNDQIDDPDVMELIEETK